MEAKCAQQCRKQSVEFVAEAAAATAHDLVDQVGLIQGDGLGQVNAQVLERHRQLMRQVQRAQTRRVTGSRRGGKALMVLSVDTRPPAELVERIRAEGFDDARVIEL